MKYKVGDKVKIKTWEEMEKEFGLRTHLQIKDNGIRLKGICFFKEDEEKLSKNYSDRILTIKRVFEKYNYYKIEELWTFVSEDMIERLVEKYREPVPIYSRFEILDL